MHHFNVKLSFLLAPSKKLVFNLPIFKKHMHTSKKWAGKFVPFGSVVDEINLQSQRYDQNQTQEEK